MALIPILLNDWERREKIAYWKYTRKHEKVISKIPKKW